MSALLSGCPTTYSNAYRPANEAEGALLRVARRDVYPDDVRQNLELHRGDLVLWTGIIRATDTASEPGVLRLRIEHHYWDWIEDHGRQKEIAFLSPRGEGFFTCAFPIGDPARAEQAAERIDDMAIVYGTPQAVSRDDGTIDLRCANLRTLDREYYSTEIWDYGRNFSDVKKVERP